MNETRCSYVVRDDCMQLFLFELISSLLMCECLCGSRGILEDASQFLYAMQFRRSLQEMRSVRRIVKKNDVLISTKYA